MRTLRRFTLDPHENLVVLRDHADRLGFSLCGAAPLGRVREYCHPSLLEALPERITQAIALGFRLSDATMDSLLDRPTPLYAFHYNRANALIDSRALDLMTTLQEQGFQALPIPASQVVDQGSQRGHVMHKLVAVEAGLGFIGRSNLFVAPAFGARIRLATVFTDLPLESSARQPFGCGECRLCLRRCPAGAIGERPEDYRLDLCDTKIRGFQRIMFVTKGICGVCQSACRGRQPA